MFTNAILTFTKGKILITAEENERLKRVRATDWFACSEGKIKGSAIAEIITIGDYYSRFPNERPPETKLFIAPAREDYGESIEEYAARDKKRSTLLLSGLKRYCLDNPGAKNAAELYKKKFNKHFANFGGTEDEIPVYQGLY